MVTSPIIPIWIMILICIAFIIIILKNKKNLIQRLLIVILLFIINLRIMTVSTNSNVLTNSLDVLFVIDNTISMVAEDYNGKTPRLTAIKDDCEYIINELSGARFSIVTFNDTSQILIPYTKDANMTNTAIKTLTIADSFYAQGSSLNVALNNMLKQLQSSKKSNDRKSVVFFISDGEITNDDKLKSFSETKKYIDNGAILGYGTTAGGYMKVTEKYTNETSYVEDRTADYPYPKAVSKIDETNLKNIANDTGLDYIYMNKQGNIKSKLKEIKKDISQAVSEENTNSFSDIYYIFVIPLLILLVSEFINYKKTL